MPDPTASCRIRLGFEASEASCNLDTDENLMLRFGRGEAAAFEALYRRHEAPVFRFLRRSLRDESSANDVLQEVWFAVARAAPRYQPTAKFTTWLYRIAHHRMVDAVRRLRPAESLTGEEPDEEEGAATPAATADPADEPPAQLETQDEAAALLAAVEQLPAEQRSAFLLQAEGDLSVAEIAEATGTSFETAKSRLRYARAKLRQLLWEFA